MCDDDEVSIEAPSEDEEEEVLWISAPEIPDDSPLGRKLERLREEERKAKEERTAPEPVSEDEDGEEEEGVGGVGLAQQPAIGDEEDVGPEPVSDWEDE